MGNGAVQVEVVYALPGRYWAVSVELPVGGTAADALAAARSSLPAEPCQFEPAGLAVFGRAVQPATVLRDGDRLEVLRALVADPKQARRARAGGSARGD